MASSIWEITPFAHSIVNKARQFDKRFLRSNYDHRVGSDGKPKFPKEECPQLTKDYVSEMPRIEFPHKHIQAAKRVPGNKIFE